MAITVRVHGELASLTSANTVKVAPVGRRSVKDLIGSVGIPHCEVGLACVDGEPVDLTALVSDEATVETFSPSHPAAVRAGQPSWPTPPEPRRFVLDVHLGTLARRLRLLGFDTWYRTDADDGLLAEVAVAERRILLSRDRQLLMRRAIVHGHCPLADDPDEQLLDVARRYDLAHRLAPLTRCVTCNGPLAAATAAEVRDQVPPRSRAAFERFARCGSCGQVFWPGSHMVDIDAIVGRVSEHGHG